MARFVLFFIKGLTLKSTRKSHFSKVFLRYGIHPLTFDEVKKVLQPHFLKEFFLMRPERKKIVKSVKANSNFIDFSLEEMTENDFLDSLGTASF